MFAKELIVKMEDWYLIDVDKFPMLTPRIYLDCVPYDGGIVRVELKHWVLGLHKAGLLNLLQVPHFERNLINDICVLQLLTLFHDEALWLGEFVPIDSALIHRIIALPNQGTNPMADFGGKGQKKKVADKIKAT